MYTRCGEESVSLRHKFRMVSVSASLGDVFGGVGLYSRPGESFAYTAAFGAIPEGFYLCYDTRHESPLSSILMGAHILNSGKLSGKPGKEEKYRQAMMEECEHLLTLSNRVLVLTKLDEGHLELHQERCLCGLYLMI